MLMKTTAQQLKQQTDAPFQAKAKNQGAHSSILQAYKGKTVQQQSTREEELLQGKFETTQLATKEEEETLQRQPNNTGLPDNLKSGIENLSGYSMNDVKVHYNSSQPATLQAHAYAQGTDIHVAPGQEKHLPHEAWHVVQQKQGRVKPTRQMKGKVNVNDDMGLEKEADVMGAKAVQMKSGQSTLPVYQFVTQDDVEAVISDKIGVKSQIDSYGGLCGGWSISLLKEKDGLEIWKQFEKLYNDGDLVGKNITKPMINYFKKVMKNQYILDLSDYMNYDDDEREEREVGIAILGTALDSVGLNAKPTIDRNAARYNVDEYQIRDQKQLSDIKEMVMSHGAVLIATDTHFMSIKKVSDSKFLLSETNKTGYDTKTWTGVVKSLKDELISSDYVIHIKYM